jgi:hypothetical protein
MMTYWFCRRKSCPSCRKTISGKLIRLFPSIGEDQNNGGRNNNEAGVGDNGNIGVQNVNAEAAAGGVGNQPAAVGNGGPCQNAQCVDLRLLHGLLELVKQALDDRCTVFHTLFVAHVLCDFFCRGDNRNLHERINDKNEEIDLAVAQINSLQEETARQRL